MFLLKQLTDSKLPFRLAVSCQGYKLWLWQRLHHGAALGLCAAALKKGVLSLWGLTVVQDT